MKKSLLTILAGLNLLLILGVVNGKIYLKQRVVDEGRTVFLQLAPVDPRSLMQGDYMILRQALSQQIPRTNEASTRGTVVISLNEKLIGTYTRLHDGSTALAENEMLLKYRRSNRSFHFGLESYFFQEGDAKRYERAKFCEVKVDTKGNAVLVNLRGEGLAVLGGS